MTSIISPPPAAGSRGGALPASALPASALPASALPASTFPNGAFPNVLGDIRAVQRWFGALLLGRELDVPSAALNPFYEAAQDIYRVYLAHGSYPLGVGEAQRALTQTMLNMPELAAVLLHLRRLIRAERLYTLPQPSWLLDGLLPAQSLCELHGQPGSGKSLLALHLAAQVAQKQPVIYVAAEGAHGYPPRMTAWQTAHGKQPGELFFHLHPVNLLDAQEALLFSAACEVVRPALVVFDTLARCMVGGEENSARDMGLLIERCRQLQTTLRTTVLLVHHTGKKQGAPERGSSALRGACDVMLAVRKLERRVRVECSKLKDGAPFDPLYFRITPSAGSVALLPAEEVFPPAPDWEIATMPENQRTVLRLLARAEHREDGLAFGEISRETGMASGGLVRIITPLCELGLIQHGGRGTPYQITSEGLEAVEYINR